MRTQVFLILIMLFCANFGTAQDNKLAVPDTIRVSNIAQQQGLSQLNVLSFDFDDNGYLWAGTEDGLNRFNSYEMRVFSQDEPESAGLVDDHIRGLLYLKDTLWLGTNTHSVQTYILSQNKFSSVIDEELLAANPALRYCHKIFEIDERYLLASTLKNCVLIDRRTLEVTTIPLPNPTVNDYVMSLSKISENRLWLGTYLNGILKLDIGKNSIEEAPELNMFKEDPVYALKKSGSGDLYIGSENGVYLYDDSFKKVQKIFKTGSEQPVRSFFDWNKDQFLIGSSKGLVFLDKRTHEIQPVIVAGYNGESYSPVEVLQIERDAAGGIWMATQGKGMFYHHPSRQKFTPRRITLPNEPEKDYISIFNFLRENQTLWMTTTLGFVKHDLENNTYKLYRTNRLGYTIVKDLENNIWGGGFNQGLEKYNRDRDLFEQVSVGPVIRDRDIAQITPLSKDSIWVSTWSSGIFSINPATLNSRPVKIFGKDLHRSRASFISSDSSIWLGADDGLYRVKDGKTSKYEHDPENAASLSNNRVFSITEDAKNNLWIGTAKGLNKLDLAENRISQYLEQPGLPNDFIYGVLSDSNDDIWVSTNRGISRLDHETGKFTNFTERDGLQNNEFNGKAAYKDSLGYLYFGGMNGFNIFHPDSIPVNEYVGKTIIEEVELFGTPVEKNIVYEDTISFNYDENVITFNFASLNFLLPEKNRYQFKMLGFDKDWRPVTGERSTTYTNLNPGTYTFMVRGSNNDLMWGTPDFLTLTIRAPWYATPYFRILAALVVVLLTLSIFYIRYSQKKAENLRLQRMVKERTAELSQSNQDLSKAMNLAKAQKENISFLMQELNHRVKNNLQLITSLLDIQKESLTDELTKNNLQNAQNRLFTIAKVHDLLSTKKPEEDFNLHDFIVTLTHELLSFMGADVRPRFDLAPLEVKKKQLTTLGIIINELVTNTLKHAFTPSREDKQISISLYKKDSYAELVYHDNGKGLPPDLKSKENSLGLNLIQNLSRQLKGEMEILEGNGTTVIIRFQY